MKHLYGPVKSRRLGLSLGVSLTPYKICSFDCVYCQLGRTDSVTAEVKEYVPLGAILDELTVWLKHNSLEAQKLNYITFSGFGEPTLHVKFGELISEIKKITPVPVAIITNASLCNMPAVRKALLQADLIVPSLDAATHDIFQRIDRPEASIKLEDIIEGLVSLRKEFKGKFWLEIMLVKGINDDPAHIKELKKIIKRINPDKIQLNSPVRPPAEPDVFPVDRERLEEIKEILGEKCEII
jgi:wyosine [tRNA(Phe)-imidazoG37] synthetase (radical SAM superfamily)